MHPFVSKATCRICGAPLSVHDQVRGDTCSRPECQRQRLRRQLQADAEQQRRLREQADQWQTRLRERQELHTADPAPVVLLPANERPLRNLPERRIRRFRDYLMQSLSTAAARRASQAVREAVDPQEEPGNSWPVVEDPPTLAVLGQACATCRGHCCSQGGEHAFQRPEVMRRYLERHPELRPRDVLQAYLDHLPRVSYENSCVYHTRHGCNLPPDMRSSTCHDYLCEGLREIHEISQETNSPRVFATAVASSADGSRAAVRGALLQPDQRWELAAPPAASPTPEQPPRREKPQDGESNAPGETQLHQEQA